MTRPTVRDVAAAAGLSVASVSRALSGARPVSPEVLARVQAAAAELQYTPNRAGRALRSGKTGLIGVVMPDLAGPFFPRLIDAIMQDLDGAGLAGIVMGAHENLAAELRCVRTLLDRGVDGLLISPVSQGESREALDLAASAMRVVQVHRWCAQDLPRVLPDVDAAMREVRAHLTQQGWVRPCFVGPSTPSSAAVDRARAFRQTYPDATWLRSDGFGVGDGASVARQALDMLGDIDAFVCASDFLAIGLMRELQSRGHAIPERLAVIGYDGTQTGALVEPALTSIDPDAGAQGKAAVAAITELESPVGTIAIAPLLRVRASSLAAPGARQQPLRPRP